jgi:hypothetical protein
MNTFVTTIGRKMLTRSFAAGLLASAMTMLPGANDAQAVDQQVSDEARQNAASHRAVEQGYGYWAAPSRPSGAYAQAPRHIHRSGIAVPPAELDFQLQGRP